ncbi:unnamed protein product [Symbiodinium sp. KB8]|nr:unnamed protein product [Symbiodinium sp. KB8]
MEVQRQTSGKSEREKVEEFALQREIERLRSFYFVLQLAFATLASGVILTALTELVWRNLPAGRTTESIISGLSVLAWFLTSASITIVSTCPIDEVDLNSFMHLFFLARTLSNTLRPRRNWLGCVRWQHIA